MAAEIFCSPLLLSSSLLRCMTLLTMYSFRLSCSCSKKLRSFPKSSQDKLLFQFWICGPLARLLSCSAGTHGRACTCASSSPCCAGAGSLGDVGSLRVFWLSHFLPLSLFFPTPLSSESLKGMVGSKGFREETAGRRAG